MLSCPVGRSVPSRALSVLSDALRQRRAQRGTRGRRLDAGEQALLIVAYLRTGETYEDLAAGFDIGTTTVFRYVHEGLAVLAARAPTWCEVIEQVRRKTFAILDGTLLRIDRVGMASGQDRPCYSGKHTCHGVNVQVLADPAGRLIWASPALPRARHDIGAARDHGLLDALRTAGIPVLAAHGHQGAEAHTEVPQRHRRRDRDTGHHRRLSRKQEAANPAHARRRGPGERANAQLKSRKVLRAIRSCPTRTTDLINAIQVLIHAS